MPITFNSQGGFLNGTISSSGNNIFIKTSGSVGIVHLDGDKVLLQSQSSGNIITASLKIEDDNLVINENLKVKRNEFRFKSADRTKEVKIDVSDNGNIRFKDNDDKEIVKFREGGRIDLGQNDTANSQSLTNWNGAISASGFVKCKNTFLGHNYGFPDNFILAHSDRVQNEDPSTEAGRGFAFGQNPAGHTFINAGDGTNAGYESINFYQAGLPSSILGKNRNWQFGAPASVQFEPPEKLTVEGNISASGNLIIQGSISASSINTTIVSSSIVFSSGSNIFGDASSDTHTFTGHITASGNISATGTGSFDGGMIIPNSTRITFGSIDTFISVDNDNPEDLVIASDDDMFISPDDDLFLNADDVMIRTAAGSEYARFNGGVGGLGIGRTVPDQLLHVEGTNAQINIEEDDTEFLRLGVGEDENDAVIGFHTDNFLRIGTYSSPTDTTMAKLITIDYTGNITSSANISSSGTITMLTASIGGGIFTSASLAAGGGGGAVSAVANGSNNRVATFSSTDALNGESGLTFSGAGNTLTIDAGVVANSGNNDQPFQVKGSSDDNLLQVNPQSDDKVGIGTANPTKKLQVTGDISASGDIHLQTDEFIYFKTGDTSDNRIRYSNSQDLISIKSDQIYLDADNGVGIGVFNPETALEVDGNILTSGHITASGNISSSGTLDVTGNVNFDGDLDVDGTTNVDTIDVDGPAVFASRTVFEISTFTDGDTTPDVRFSTIFKTANTGATTITGFDNGTAGQIIHVVLQDNNTDFTTGTNLVLFRSLNYTSGQTNDIVSFLCLDGTKWLMLNIQDNS